MATTLAEMFGAVGFPVAMFPGRGLIMFAESDSPPIRRKIDDEMDMQAKDCKELMETLVMQSAIGK